jgi:GNAT superfamily N-acetyltransferase
MGHEFTKAAGVESDDDSIYATLLNRIEAGGLFVVGQPVVGMAAVLVYPNYYKLADLAAQEMFWWVDPSARRNGAGWALFAAIKEWAKEQGAKTLTMVSLDALDGEKVAGMYMSDGFKPLERSFVRHL